MNEFKVGDVVRLKSGGPFLTVSVMPDGIRTGTTPSTSLVRCLWFHKGELKWSDFYSDVLVDVPKRNEE